MVQWLGLGAFTAVAWVPSLVEELRSRNPRSMAKKKKKKEGAMGMSRETACKTE